MARSSAQTTTNNDIAYYIFGPNSSGAITLIKHEGTWRIQHCPPYLRKVIGKDTVSDVANFEEFLKRKGYVVRRLVEQ